MFVGSPCVRRWTKKGVLLCAFLSSCSSGGDSHPQDGSSNGAVDAPRRPPSQTPAIFHEVQPGETLWNIARAYEVSVEAIMQANGLSAADVRRLGTGQKLRIPGALRHVDVAKMVAAEQAQREMTLRTPPTDGAFHVLVPGETLWDLARTYDKPIDEILERNNLTEDDVRTLRPGHAVVIPGIRTSEVTRAQPAARSGVEHTVERGETVWDLAASFHVSVAEIMAANSLGTHEVTALREGTKLLIPGVTADRRGRVHRKTSDRQREATALGRRLGFGTRRAAGRLMRGDVDGRWLRAAGGNGRALPGTLRWPVTKGTFVRGYGSGRGGYHLAVDILGEIGWNVRAAAPGIVGYAGNEISGYGNVVMVVHPGGWVTMYAHNSVNFVVAGERVDRGTILAEVGSTGIARGPHVHFELIHRGRNCDPSPLFRPGVRFRTARRREAEGDVDKVAWTNPAARPEEIRCSPRKRFPRSEWVIHEDPTVPDE